MCPLLKIYNLGQIELRIWPFPRCFTHNSTRCDGICRPPTPSWAMLVCGNRKDLITIQHWLGGRGAGKKICSFGYLKCVSLNETCSTIFSNTLFRIAALYSSYSGNLAVDNLCDTTCFRFYDAIYNFSTTVSLVTKQFIPIFY